MALKVVLREIRVTVAEESKSRQIVEFLINAVLSTIRYNDFDVKNVQKLDMWHSENQKCYDITYLNDLPQLLLKDNSRCSGYTYTLLWILY